MKIVTTLFKTGGSMAVRIPKKFRLKSRKVTLEQKGSSIVIKPVNPSLSDAFSLLADLPADVYAEERVDLPPQSRDEL